jgi:hypothetical protein
MDFDPASFIAPSTDWTPPYPYCPDDVLFLVEKPEVTYEILEESSRSPLTVALKEKLLGEQLPANDSLGG